MLVHASVHDEFLSRLPPHAEVLAGGRSQGLGFFVEATVVAGVSSNDDVVQQGIFGPVLTLQSFADEAEALRMANGVDFGLASSLWTRDHGRAIRFSTELDFRRGVGQVAANCCPSRCHTACFKQSGVGKDLSVYGFEGYTRIKRVMSAHA